MPSHTGDLFAELPSASAQTSATPRARAAGRSGAGAQAAPSAMSSKQGWALTAHCDGGARGNPGPAGFGVEIRDGNGMVVAELSEFLGIATNNVAEYSGLLATLQYALDHGAPSLSVVSDSELMVKQIQGRYKVSSPDLKPLWAEAKRRIGKLERFEISHALRHKNKAADRLANEAMDRGTRRPHPPGSPAPPPLRATPYPNAKKSQAEVAVPRREQTTVPIVRGGGDPARGTPATVASGADATPPVVAAEQKSAVAAEQQTEQPMLRGFTRDGVVHILGSHALPDGRFVKIIPE